MTSVKLSENGKKTLDALQADITLRAKEKISQQELLELVLDDAWERRKELVSKVKSQRFPLSEKEIKRILSMPRDWGVVTCEEDVDKYLYGKE